jgi:hypothetical protein
MDNLPIDEVADGNPSDQLTTAAEASKSPTALSLAELRERIGPVSNYKLT